MCCYAKQDQLLARVRNVVGGCPHNYYQGCKEGGGLFAAHHQLERLLSKRSVGDCYHFYQCMEMEVSFQGEPSSSLGHMELHCW